MQLKKLDPHLSLKLLETPAPKIQKNKQKTPKMQNLHTSWVFSTVSISPQYYGLVCLLFFWHFRFLFTAFFVVSFFYQSCIFRMETRGHNVSEERAVQICRPGKISNSLWNQNLSWFFFFDYTNSGTKLLSFQISRAGGAKASPRYALHCLTSLTVSTSWGLI